MKLRVRRSALPAWLFLIVLLSTEFVWIRIGSGVLRPYHFLMPIMVLVLISAILRLRGSPTFLVLAGFVGCSVVSAILASNPTGALTSLVLLVLNVLVAMVVAALLNSNRIQMRDLISFLKAFTVVSVLWALIQFLAHRVGVSVPQSATQVPQINAGFAPSFFTEANTYAKFLVAPFFLSLPALLRKRMTYPRLMFFGLIAAAFLINFMRTAFFGTLATLGFVTIWFLWTRSFSSLAVRGGKLVALLGVALVPALLSGSLVSEYNLYKFTTLFDADALSEDGSWTYRTWAMRQALNQTLQGPSEMAFGIGWGQAYVMAGDQEVQFGGGDALNVFVFNGALGIVAYVLLIAFALRAAARKARRPGPEEERLLAEGVLFALVAMTFVAQISGMMLVPIFWLLIGVAIAYDCELAREKAQTRFLALRPAQ